MTFDVETEKKWAEVTHDCGGHEQRGFAVAYAHGKAVAVCFITLSECSDRSVAGVWMSFGDWANDVPCVPQVAVAIGWELENDDMPRIYFTDAADFTWSNDPDYGTPLTALDAIDGPYAAQALGIAEALSSEPRVREFIERNHRHQAFPPSGCGSAPVPVPVGEGGPT